MNHTPGPWIYFGDDDSLFWGEIRGTETFELIAKQPELDDRHDDFVLMAVAPDLLAVCEQVLAWASAGQEENGDFAYFSEHIWQRLEDVVKKAKGE